MVGLIQNHIPPSPPSTGLQPGATPPEQRDRHPAEEPLSQAAPPDLRGLPIHMGTAEVRPKQHCLPCILPAAPTAALQQPLRARARVREGCGVLNRHLPAISLPPLPACCA